HDQRFPHDGRSQRRTRHRRRRTSRFAQERPHWSATSRRPGAVPSALGEVARLVRMPNRRFAIPLIWSFLVLIATSISTNAAGAPFALRGYYITLMRMPVMGLAEWKQAVDCFAEDDANTLILWTAAGFRSHKF